MYKADRKTRTQVSRRMVGMQETRLLRTADKDGGEAPLVPEDDIRSQRRGQPKKKIQMQTYCSEVEEL